MVVNPHIFRGYDIRGVVDKDLTPQIAYHIGRAYATFLQQKKISQKAIVGRDCRLSSPALAKALIKGITEGGVEVIDIGLTLVGMFYWSQYFLNIRGGVMVTASHNPAEYNGFKLAIDFSETMVSEQIQAIKQIIESQEYYSPPSPSSIISRSITQDYFQDILRRFPRFNFRVVVDPSHSTPGAFIPELLRQAGCEVIEQNTQIDGNFPLGTPDPTEQMVAERLAQAVVKRRADLGFSYDADGDRIGVVTEKGEIIWNDLLVALLAADVLDKHPGATIMFNTLCSKVVTETIIQRGGKPFMWRTGHSFLKKKNQEVGAAFIGELSGHFFFSQDFYNHDDGAYTTLRLLDYLARHKTTLSQALVDLPKYISSPEIKIGCSEDKKADFIRKISPRLRQDFPQAEVIDDERAGDGVRLEMPTSMLVVRYSQNGPYLTIKFEAKDKEGYNKLKQYLRKLLAQYPEIDWGYGVNLDSLNK